MEKLGERDNAVFIYIGHGAVFVENGREMARPSTAKYLRDKVDGIESKKKLFAYFGCYPKQYNDAFGNLRFKNTPEDDRALGVTEVLSRLAAWLPTLRKSLDSLRGRSTDPDGIVDVFVYFGEHEPKKGPIDAKLSELLRKGLDLSKCGMSNDPDDSWKSRFDKIMEIQNDVRYR